MIGIRTCSSSTFTKQLPEKIVFQTIFYFQDLSKPNISLNKKLFCKSGAGLTVAALYWNLTSFPNHFF